MNWTEILAGQLNAATQRLYVALGDNADIVINRINTDEKYVEQIVEHMIASAISLPENSQWTNAHGIMEENFFGVEEAIKYFGVVLSQKQLKTLSEIPFSEEVLQETKETHILIAVCPLSILDIRDKVKQLFYRFEGSWYDNLKFAQEYGETGWKLVRKTPVPDSTSKNREEQEVLLKKEEEIPTAQVMIYTIIGHYLAMNERLFERIYVRTSSLGSDGDRVGVGCFASGGLRVDSYWDSLRHGGLAVSSSRKS